MTYTTSINPFYAARVSSAAHEQPTQTVRPIYARLPRAPKNASPVPHLTSLHHFDAAGNYGNRSYPGNCGGELIKDLLLYFRPSSVFDPMTGSGTCRDVCQELGIDCLSTDLRAGFDACAPGSYTGDTRFDFIWIHPPYWRQKVYSDDPRDLSQTPTLGDFLGRYADLIAGCDRVLHPGGKLAVLMGDYCDREEGFVPLTYYTKQLALERRLRQHCTDIIRFSHGASSSRKTYRSAFIPGLHDVCMIFEKDAVTTAKDFGASR